MKGDLWKKQNNLKWRCGLIRSLDPVILVVVVERPEEEILLPLLLGPSVSCPLKRKAEVSCWRTSFDSFVEVYLVACCPLLLL